MFQGRKHFIEGSLMWDKERIGRIFVPLLFGAILLSAALALSPYVFGRKLSNEKYGKAKAFCEQIHPGFTKSEVLSRLIENREKKNYMDSDSALDVNFGGGCMCIVSFKTNGVSSTVVQCGRQLPQKPSTLKH